MSATQVQEIPTVEEALDEYLECISYAYKIQATAQNLLCAVMWQAKTGERGKILSNPEAIRLLHELRELKHSR